MSLTPIKLKALFLTFIAVRGAVCAAAAAAVLFTPAEQHTDQPHDDRQQKKNIQPTHMDLPQTKSRRS